MGFNFSKQVPRPKAKKSFILQKNKILNLDPMVLLETKNLQTLVVTKKIKVLYSLKGLS
jgi:hypothetical protein